MGYLGDYGLGTKQAKLLMWARGRTLISSWPGKDKYIKVRYAQLQRHALHNVSFTKFQIQFCIELKARHDDR